MSSAKEAVREVPKPKPAGAIASAWRAFDPAWLTDAPAARRWLLKHPTRDGKQCAPCAGDGLFPLGKAGLLVADGGIGKTMALAALAVSIPTGRPWLGHFEIDHAARKGRVLLALAEEDLEEVHRRLYAVARAYNLDADERARVSDRLVVLPLAGRSVSLLGFGPDGRTLIDSSELVALRERLTNDAGADGWSLVVLDPLARWGTEETETANAVATRTMQAAETLLEVPGGPSVLLAHHASQIAVRTGAITARGATGIRNAARWEAVLREDGGAVYFRQSKSNYSRPMPDELPLVRGPGGLLRVPTDAEEQEHKERAEERASSKDAEKVDRTEAQIAALEVAIVAALRTSPAPVTTRDDLVALVAGKCAPKEAAVSRLLTSGRVVRRPPPARGEKASYVPGKEPTC